MQIRFCELQKGLNKTNQSTVTH